MKPSKIWISHCETAREILSESGVIQALDYLVAQKLAHYLEVAKTDADFKKELNAFQSEIWSIFKESELNAYLMNLVRTTAMYEIGRAHV